MKKVMILIMLLCSTLFISCGTGDPPSISGLQYSPSSATAGSGLMSVSGSFYFTDPDGDLAYGKFSYSSCGVGPLQDMQVPIAGVEGAESGLVGFLLFGDTSCPAGQYNILVSAIDEEGNESNTLVATFTLN